MQIYSIISIVLFSMALLFLISGLFFSSYYKNKLEKVKMARITKSLLILSALFFIVTMAI